MLFECHLRAWIWDGMNYGGLCRYFARSREMIRFRGGCTYFFIFLIEFLIEALNIPNAYVLQMYLGCVTIPHWTLHWP